MPSRRKFLRNSALTGAGLTLGFSALANKAIPGANDRVRVAIFGTNSRGESLTQTFAGAKNCQVYGIGDVDTRAIAKGQKAAVDKGQAKPKGEQDFRRFLDDKDVDAVVIATPDHWHAPMAMMALDAGKHVYVEKPCSQNPYEGELLIAKQASTGLLVQMGNQTRSSVSLNQVIKEIHDGLIGEAYAGKAWYSNSRDSIGRGKVVAVPEWLDWELWQGPAPRRPYKDNIVHYNWHWLWHYGTGELLNNGTHEVDLCRWALDVHYPIRVTSTGGRYHFDDDWEAYDTQVAGYEFPGGKTINWEGRSCNGMPMWGRGRGAFIHGTKGSVLLDRAGYWLYDLGGKEIRVVKEEGESVSMGTAGGGNLDDLHIRNFLAGITENEKLNSPIDDANPSVTICHLGNIAQRTGGSFHTDPETGKPTDDPQAMELWSREYEPGWEPK
ncbi:Gfo/Idh/MocA family oxidoreductase [Neolewinella lacunae]|uniref:Gfo/Idh/MocA family oxidoreductase n=1 Tax=Neolewinella lacunae TaxID=1517758 RepID=A0A923TDU5_9BACT|nr:Gfo/Idh/MocA family oxidoreductase [Neolewinella lacunae]MBC6995232.1 Gfo/Idh/MocA family oxidoreductase [Neolewinella lacunae]MDN3635459.1 Gfo/Idh/MocA family oxidoreductase [Neolewinella lacunae]